MTVEKNFIIAPDAAVLAGRRGWRHTGAQRPDFAQPIGDGEESVWDYPRPPRQDARAQIVEVRVGSELIARSTRAVRVLETASAPTWYIPPEDVREELLIPSGTQSMCEWKGLAQGFNIGGRAVGPVTEAGWRYVRVFPEFENLHLWCAFYPQRVDCFVDGEQMRAQPGGFYGGWVGSKMTGPIKGAPGSSGW